MTHTTRTAAPNSLEVRDLRVRFETGHGPTDVVDDVSFSIPAGKTLGLVGESGSGKSVTALAIMGLLPRGVARVSRGSVHLHGIELTKLTSAEMASLRGSDVSMIFQEPMTSLDPAFKIGEQIASSVRRHLGLTRKQAWDRAVEVLHLVGISSPGKRAHDYPHTFSGGMRQRVMIAIALACEPTVLIADEPTTALDVTIQAQVLELLADLQAQMGMSILFITHDLGVVAEICDEVIVMYAGQSVEVGEGEHLFTSPQHPYTEGLLACLPSERIGQSLMPIRGLVPPPHEIPAGCRFHPRCDHALAGRCDTDVVPLVFDPESHRETRCVRSPELLLRGVER